MDQQKLERLRKNLVDMRDHAENTMVLMKKNNEAEQGVYYPTELSSYDNHPADTGSQLYELEHNNALMVHQEFMFREITDAISRIEKGAYGICDFCGREIDDERLEAIPYTRLCMDCESHKSSDSEIIRRKPPYMESELHAKWFLTEWDDTEFEGIDQLNDLTKYGSSDTPQDISSNKDMRDFYTNETDRQGVVDPLDLISNEQYKKQLPD